MDHQASPCILERTCLTRPHVLDAILDNLSASESAYLLAVLGLLSNEHWETTRKKYVDPMRDIPEYAPWIKDMMSHGHRVYLISNDLHRWMMRLQYPLLYWKQYQTGTGSLWDEEPLKIWIAARVKRGADREMHPRLQGIYQSYGICPSGEVLRDRAVIKERQKQGMVVTRSNVIPLDSHSHTSPPQWRRSTTPNANNIRVVWREFPQSENRDTPVVQICPIKAEDRGKNDRMGGYHGTVKYGCDSLSPGADISNFYFFKDQVVPALHYMDAKSGKVHNAEVLEPHEAGGDNYAFLIKFYCIGASTGSSRGMARGPVIRADLQGIPWDAC